MAAKIKNKEKRKTSIVKKANGYGGYDKNFVLSIGIFILVLVMVVYFYGTLMTENLSSNKTPPQKSVNYTSRTGSLYITSDPEGANVSIDNILQGSTPLVYDLPSGVYTVTLSKQGYKTNTSQVSIDPDKPASLIITLVKLSSMPESSNVSSGSNQSVNLTNQTGTLSVQSFPPKAKVLVDNQTIGDNILTPTVLYNITAGNSYNWF